MTKAEKVVWTEGMFLRPHHFQRTESYLLNHVREWGPCSVRISGAFSTLSWMKRCFAVAVLP